MNSAVTLVDFDRLLNGLDHIYSEFSRACGLSDCAYWMLVDTSTAGGSIAVSRLTSEWFYSKQTINSALRKLETDGHILLRMADGKRKIVCLTESGKIYAARTAGRLLAAENEIYGAWPKEDLEAYLRLAEKYLTELREKSKELENLRL